MYTHNNVSMNLMSLNSKPHRVTLRHAGAASAGQADKEPPATGSNAETTQAASGEGSWHRTHQTYPETEHRKS